MLIATFYTKDTIITVNIRPQNTFSSAQIGRHSKDLISTVMTILYSFEDLFALE